MTYSGKAAGNEPGVFEWAFLVERLRAKRNIHRPDINLLPASEKAAARWITGCLPSTEPAVHTHPSSIQSPFRETLWANPTLPTANITSDSFASGLKSLSGN